MSTDGSQGPKDAVLLLFQQLATAAGYDPVRGPGSSCLGSGASGKCVLPWGSGTRSVNSIVLLANGISFAVSRILYTWPHPLILSTIFRLSHLSSQRSDQQLIMGRLVGGRYSRLP